MTEGKYRVSKTGKIVFYFAIAMCLFWISGSSFRVYDVPFVGALFEFLWLPALMVTLLIPVLSVFFLLKEKLSFRSPYLYSILIIVTTIVYLQYFR